MLALAAGCLVGIAARAAEPSLTPAQAPAAAPAADAPKADSTAEAVKPDAPAADKPVTRTHRPPQRRTVAQGIEDSVRRLSRGLDLDATQQARLRQLLWDEHREMQAKVRQNPQPGVDRAAVTAAIIDHTKEQIRAMLNDEQKKKYTADVPREMTAPSRSDLEHWIDVQNSKRKPGGDAAK